MKTLRVAVLLLLVQALAVQPCSAANPSPPAAARSLAVVPFYAPERMWQLYAPLIEHLKRETGERWELKLYANHEALVEGVCAGATDVTLLGPVPLARVNKKCGAVPFLVPLGKDGQPVYHAMLLTSDPAVTTVAGLRGKKVGFFKGSTAAHVVPLRMLRDAGLGPGAFEIVFFESQDRIMTALLAREIAGAGVKSVLYRRFEKEPLRLLQTSEPLPNFAFAALPSLSPAVRERFAATLLKLRPLRSAADAAAVKGWDDEIKNGFVTPPRDFLPAVLSLLETTEKLLHENP